MMKQSYQQLIAEGIQGLPSETLAEIADFVYFVRKRVLQPQVFEQDRQRSLLRAELKQMSRDEQSHLEQEFENYDQLYPLE